MSDTSISITAGSGTSIDTRTEATNGNHRQVIVIGDPSTNAGVAPVDATAGLKVDLGTDNDVTVSSSALPTGASTSENQTTIIGHVDGIEATLTTIDTDTGDLVTSLGFGSDAAATAGSTGTVQAKLRLATSQLNTITGHVDGIEGLLTTIDGDTGNISTKIDTIAGAVSGTEVQVDVLTLPGVTGAAAHDAAVSGNPVLQGAEAHTVRPAAVADGDVVRVGADVYSRLLAIKPRVTTTSSNGTPITTNTNTSAVAAPSAGSHLRIYRVFAQNSSATGTWLYWTEGSGGTKVIPMYLAQNQAMTLNLEGTWELATATALFINTATTGANIEWAVQHETVID